MQFEVDRSNDSYVHHEEEETGCIREESKEAPAPGKVQSDGIFYYEKVHSAKPIASYSVTRQQSYERVLWGTFCMRNISKSQREKALFILELLAAELK